MPTDCLVPGRIAREDQWAPSEPELPPPATYQCDFCGSEQTGHPAGSGLLIWTRGEEVRYDQPPLCEDCAKAIATTAFMCWSLTEDDGE